MKKFLKYFSLCFLFICSLGFAFFPVIEEKNVFAQSDVTEITSLSQIVNMNGNYKLKNDISGVTKPIGTKESPFTGTFDGDGHKIEGLSLNTTSSYQGLFGYTSGAEIKNIKIANSNTKFGASFKLSETPNNDEFFVGAIVGYADNQTVISCCEVEDVLNISSSSNKLDISYKTTFGTIVGVLDGASRIEDCVSYKPIEISSDLKSGYTLRIGGIAGQILDSSAIENVAYFGNINFLRKDEIKNENYIGGIVGDISGANSSIINSVSNCDIVINEVESDIDNNYLGAVAGGITPVILQAGNISSVVYTQDNLNAYGLNSGYQIFNQDTSDYVVKIPAASVGLSNFYFQNYFEYSPVEGVIKEYSWHALTGGWSQDLWTINVYESGNELRLQQFQNFQITISEQVDYSSLLKIADDTQESAEGAYGEIVALRISFKDDSDKGFYKLSKIFRNSEECQAELITQGESQTSDIAYFETPENDYVLSVRLSSKTAGTYSFRLEALKFEGELLIDETIAGGNIKFSGGTASKRTFTKDSLETSAVAKAGSLYIFKHYVLYYKTTELDAKHNGELKDGYLEINGIYWKAISPVYSSYIDETDYKFAPATLSVKFGRSLNSLVLIQGNKVYDYLNQDFLLKAEFELDPYKISFNVKDSGEEKGLIKILVNDEDVTDKNTFASVGKAEVIKIEVHVSKNFMIDLDALKKSIQNDKNQPTITATEESNSDSNIYKLSFNTNKLDPLKMDQSEHNKFFFEVNLIKKEENQTASNLAWIIGGSVGGGVVLIVGIVLLIVYLKGGFIKTGGSKQKKNKPDDNYKNYYF